MLITPKTIELLNYRINQEQKTSKEYEQMYLWLKDKAYFNAAQLWKKNYEDELEHAGWAKDYLLSFNIMPELDSIPEPQNIFESFEEIVNKTLEIETETTMQCRALAKHALDEEDYNLLTLANKFNKEQVEELNSVYDLLNILKLSSDKLIIELYIKENILEN